MDYEFAEEMSRERLHNSIDQDSHDAAIAERAKARIAEAVKRLREYISADAEAKARAADAEYPTRQYSDKIPNEYALPLHLAEEMLDVLRDLANMGVAIRCLPDELSVERRYRQYIIDVCRAAWAEGVHRAPDALEEYLRGNA